MSERCYKTKTICFFEQLLFRWKKMTLFFVYIDKMYYLSQRQQVKSSPANNRFLIKNRQIIVPENTKFYNSIIVKFDTTTITRGLLLRWMKFSHRRRIIHV